MKYKKKMELSNKLFLIGLGLLSAVAVGTTFADTPHVSTSGYFDNFYDFKGYHVYSETLVDANEASSAETGKAINADSIVENTGDVPVLVRMCYINSDKIEGTQNDETNINRDKKGNIVDTEGNAVTLLDLSKDITDSIGNTESKWHPEVAPNNKFERASDGYYYYKGILSKDQSVQHLDSVTLVSTCDSSAKEQTFYKTGDYDTTDWKSGSVPSGSTETGRKSVVTFGNSDPLKLHLAVVIETIQATDTNFNDIVLPENVTVSTMKGYWDALSTTT